MARTIEPLELDPQLIDSSRAVSIRRNPERHQVLRHVAYEAWRQLKKIDFDVNVSASLTYSCNAKGYDWGRVVATIGGFTITAYFPERWKSDIVPQLEHDMLARIDAAVEAERELSAGENR